jgi:hypothetical protein
MQALTVIFAVLTAAYLAVNVNGTLAAENEEAYLRGYEEYGAAFKEVQGLIRAGRLVEAEQAVETYEPMYANKWDVGRFGYGIRMELGQAYLDRGEATEGIRLFRSATPGGGCGNCMASQQVERNVRIAMVQQSRLNFLGAFASYLGAMPSTALGGGLFRVVAGLVYSGSVMVAPFVVAGYFLMRRRHRSKKMSRPGDRIVS